MGVKGGRHTASPELIDAIRQGAAAGKSASIMADELTTRLHPLTRNAVIGIAHRNNIQLSLKPGWQPRAPKPKRDRRTIPAQLPKPAPADKPRPNFVTERVKAWVKPPRPGCSWAGCGERAEEGGMFCYGHGRKGLMG